MDVSHLFGGTYRGRRVLVTGHTGFKGAWLAFWLRELGAQVSGLALAPDTDPNHFELLAIDFPQARVDLRDGAAVRDAVQRFEPQIVFHLAAQALVRRSYREPLQTLQTNVIGLAHLLEAIRASPSVRAVVNATTDKCYENDGREGGYRESDPLGGFDPYSASKACAEIVSSSWRRSFLSHDESRGHPVLLATARAGSVVGGGDWAQDRLFRYLMRSAILGQAALIRHPDAVRPCQHVLEPLSGYLELGRRLFCGEAAAAAAWNFGPDTDMQMSVGQIAAGLAAHWPKVRIEADTRAHPHEAAVLTLDWSRARQALGWRPVWDRHTTLERTAAWYRAYYESGQVLTAQDLHAYVAYAREAALPWATA
jgi:CDP-glucose 4,6-dehydratase